MDAKQLRIGNYVIDDDGEIIRLQSVDDLRYDICYDPIPLTEEWLLRCGFEKKELNGEDWSEIVYLLDVKDGRGGDFILTYANDFSLNISGDDVDLGITPPIERFRNLHQLQNLFYILSGDELKIKD